MSAVRGGHRGGGGGGEWLRGRKRGLGCRDDGCGLGGLGGAALRGGQGW